MEFNLSFPFPVNDMNLSYIEKDTLNILTVHEYTHQAGVRIVLLVGKIWFGLYVMNQTIRF